ncbi:MAG: hypothetical protein C5B49_10955, partial [Bdellovibrio sp.]
MAKIINNLEVGLDEDLDEKLAWMEPQHGPYRILRQSIDARPRQSVHFVYSLEVAAAHETLSQRSFELAKVKVKGQALKGERPIIVGAGPAG